MKSVTTVLLTLILIILANDFSAQDFKMDVEGNAKIRGNLDINHPDDSTSVHIGRNAGANADFSIPRSNTFVGSGAGQSNTMGDDNTFIGLNAGRFNTLANSNTFIGNSSGGNNTTGTQNAFLGDASGGSNNTGSHNCFFGEQAGLDNVRGNYNSFFGTEAGVTERFGTRNTYLGAFSGVVRAGQNPDSLDRAIAIGYNAKVDCSHCAVIGGTGEDAVKVGIGVDSPTVVLTLRAPEGANPVGITQNQVGAGSSMELTTQDASGQQATRLLIKGNGDNSDIEFYRGGRSAEQLTMVIKGTNGNVGIDEDSPTQKLDVNGSGRFRAVGSGAFSSTLSLTVNGTLTTTASDRRLKENISDLSNSLDRILALRGVSFTWKEDESKEKRLGFIAQEVEEVVPELVFTNEVDGYKGVRYQEVTALLVEALKAQQSKIEALEAQQIEILKIKRELARLQALVATQ